jgi:CO/xanthine dehydrogenase FAD-binding subunit
MHSQGETNVTSDAGSLANVGAMTRNANIANKARSIKPPSFSRQAAHGKDISAGTIDAF